MTRHQPKYPDQCGPVGLDFTTRDPSQPYEPHEMALCSLPFFFHQHCSGAGQNTAGLITPPVDTAPTQSALGKNWKVSPKGALALLVPIALLALLPPFSEALHTTGATALKKVYFRMGSGSNALKHSV